VAVGAHGYELNRKTRNDGFLSGSGRATATQRSAHMTPMTAVRSGCLPGRCLARS